MREEPVTDPPRGQVSSSPVEIPTFARVQLAHPVVQRIAEEVGVSLLHLKGPALLAGLRAPGRLSSDVDVLVQPDHFTTMEGALRDHGWERYSHVSSGSAFEHAANWWHPHWGYADLHARWPGATASPADTFSALSEESFLQPIAHYPCPVPGRTAQLLVLLLHSARSPGYRDVELTWNEQSPQQRAAVIDLAGRIGGQVALAAALGHLEEHRGDPSYALWHFYRDGGGRLDEWRARYRAAPSPSGRWRVIVSAARVNRDHLRIELGRTPTRADVLTAQLGRIGKLVRESARMARAHLRKRPAP